MADIQLKDLLNTPASKAEATRTRQLTDSFTRANITADEVARFQSYLEHPVREGYWRAKGQWQYTGTFARYMFAELSAQLTAQSQVGQKTRPVFKESQQREIASQISSRITTALLMFTWSATGEQPEASQWGDLSSLKALLADFNAAEIRTRFPEAFSVFEKEIHFDNFFARPTGIDPFRVRSGLLFVVAGPKEIPDILLAGIDRKPLESMANFLTAIGMLSDAAIERVFSPEEEVFTPYFQILSTAFDQLINDERLRRPFAEAFRHYETEQFAQCVSALGLAAEDYLTQTYEYLLREECPKGLTLGQIYDALHNEIRALFRAPPPELKTVDDLYETIKEVEKASDHKRLAKLLRDVLATIKADRAYYSFRIEDLIQRRAVLSVFPPRIRENLDELIRNRNAAAHKTRVPIGNYEALRTLYCLTSFVMWWRRELQAVDWSLERTAILQGAISRAKS